VLWARGRAVIPSRRQTDKLPKTNYDSQNMQSRKEAFLAAGAAARRTTTFARPGKPPLSRYEIKAGWEIPAVLEQSLNSDLPGELKSPGNVERFDTATGLDLLIPQGSPANRKV